MSFVKATLNMFSVPQSGVLAGRNSVVNHDNSFIIGSNMTSSAANTLYVNTLSSTGSIYSGGRPVVTSVAGKGGDVTLAIADIDYLGTTLSSMEETFYTKLDITGGTVNGDLNITGNLSAKGNLYFSNTYLT